MTNFPWPDCNKEFNEWFKSYSGCADINHIDNCLPIQFTQEDIKNIAQSAWDAAILSQLPNVKV